MNSFELRDVAFNLTLFKKLGFYHIFNPSGPKIFHYNAYRFAVVVFTGAVLCANVFGLLGFVTRMEDTIDNISLLQVICAQTHNFLSIFKIGMCLYNADKFWYVLDITRMNFLTSKSCRDHIGTLRSYRDVSIKITNLYAVTYVLCTSTWLLSPLLLNDFAAATPDSDSRTVRRYNNIFNFRYPVSIRAYNSYFFLYYIIEGTLILFIGYGILIVDNLLISISYVLIALYEIHGLAFKDIRPGQSLAENNGNEKHCTEDYKDFKSIIFDQQNLYAKLQTYNSVVWSVIVISASATSTVIIMFSYSFVVIFLKAESLEMLAIFKFASAVLFFAVEIFIHCYLLENINTKRESVSFEIYCCDWTGASMKFKKLILLTMQMHDVNKPMIKMTRKKIMNLNFFANVMMSCYNIVSVMLRTIDTENVVV